MLIGAMLVETLAAVDIQCSISPVYPIWCNMTSPEPCCRANPPLSRNIELNAFTTLPAGLFDDLSALETL